MSNVLYLEYVQKMQQIADVNYAAAVLNWDQEIYLPEKGAATRSRQLATLSGISHELSVAPDLGVLLESLAANSDTLSEVENKNIAHTLKDYHRNKKYTTEFVIKMSQPFQKPITIGLRPAKMLILAYLPLLYNNW